MPADILNATLPPAPTPLTSVGPRVCVVDVLAYRHGVLNGLWLDLHNSDSALLARLEIFTVSDAGHRPVTLGLFDYEGIPGGVTGPTSIMELRRRCH